MMTEENVNAQRSDPVRNPGSYDSGQPQGEVNSNRIALPTANAVPVLAWTRINNGLIPPDAVAVYPDARIYVARAKVENDVIPGEIWQEAQAAAIPYKNRVIAVSDYEVLTLDRKGASKCNVDDVIEWKNIREIGDYTSSLFAGAYDPSNGEELYVIRARIDSHLSCGFWKVSDYQGNRRVAYIPHNNQVQSVFDFDVISIKEPKK